MILAAAILLFGISSPGLSSQESPVQAQPTAPSAQNSPSGDQSNSEQTQSPTPHTTAPPAPSSKASTAKQRRPRKKVSIAPCNASNSAGQAGSPGASNETAAQPSGTSATVPTKDCPPAKIVVQQGGTVEPSIQLAGGDQASQKRNAANQMLGSTEANLKKIALLQLSDSQKDTVVQIRQFVNQSKSALAAGDGERGWTLAWKAKLLSEDLIQPPK